MEKSLNNSTIDEDVKISKNKYTCVICIEEKDINDFIGIWNCNHLFCVECVNDAIKKGINNCFLCRSARKNRNNNEQNQLFKYCKENILNINNIRNIYKSPTNIQSYLEKWEKHQCINENHDFVIRQTYGVIMICVECNLIQCFNVIQ